MAAALPFVAVAFQTLGAISAAQGARADAKAAAQAAEYNAQTQERNAQVTREAAAHDVEMQRRQTSRNQGAIRAAYGKAGIDVEGSPLDILESSATEAELDRQTIAYRAELRARGYEDTAALDRFSGQSALARGDRQAGSAILLGASNVAKSAYGFWGGTTPTQPTDRGGSSYPGSKY